MPEHLPKILNRLGIENENWFSTISTDSGGFHSVIGPMDRVPSQYDRLQQKWICGNTITRILYSTLGFKASHQIPFEMQGHGSLLRRYIYFINK